MSAQLTNKDYVSILKYYNINIPKSKRLLKIYAENIMAEKLCRCIKKIESSNEAKSIGICTKNIFNRKGYTRGKFECSKKQSVKLRKINSLTSKKNITRKYK